MAASQLRAYARLWVSGTMGGVVVSSFGKNVTGWKVAYCLAPRELMAEYMNKPGWYEQCQALSGLRFELLPCEGTYF